MLLSGEAGAGKTHLLKQVLAASGLPTAWGDTSEFGNSEFGPLKDLCADSFASTRAMPRGFAAATRCCCSSSPVGRTTRLAQAPSREALFDGLAHGLLSLGATRPFAVVFDDLHVADHATIELLARIAERLEREATAGSRLSAARTCPVHTRYGACASNGAAEAASTRSNSAHSRRRQPWNWPRSAWALYPARPRGRPAAAVRRPAALHRGTG